MTDKIKIFKEENPIILEFKNTKIIFDEYIWMNCGNKMTKIKLSN